MDEIKGISCEVKNCKYHDGSDCCTAGHIQVGTQNAKTSTDTVRDLPVLRRLFL